MRKFKNEVTNLEEIIEEKDNSINSLKGKNEELQKKVDEAKPYFEMKEEERRQQELDAEREKYKKYLDLVDSGKSYYNMTVEERKIMDDFLGEAPSGIYINFSEELKEEYKEKFDNAKKDKEDSLARIQAEEEQVKAEAESHKYETGLTWEDIARNGKVGTYGKFEGKIVQVMNGTGFKQYRIAINDDYDTIMLVEVKDGVAKETLLEDDYVYFKGYSMGQYTYTTVLGSKLTIPSFEAEEITR